MVGVGVEVEVGAVVEAVVEVEVGAVVEVGVGVEVVVGVGVEVRRWVMKINPSQMYSIDERIGVWEDWLRVCYYCDTDLARPGTKAGRATHFDHLVPASLGGSNSLDNLRPCCKRCNTRKASSDVMEFIDRRIRQMQRASARLVALKKELE